jgi:hypothetical protein
VSVTCAAHAHVLGTCQRTVGRWPDGCNRYCVEPAGGALGYTCEAELRTALAELPDLWVQIGADLTPAVSARGGRVSGGGKSAPLPIDLGAQSLLDSISWWTRLFEEEVRTRAGLVDAMAKVRTARAVLASCSLIGRHLSVLLAIPSGTTVYDGDRDIWVDTSGLDAAERLLHLHALARGRLGQTLAKHRHPDVPCMDCGTYAITRLDGRDKRQCEACGREYDPDAWDAHLAWLERFVKAGAR